MTKRFSTDPKNKKDRNTISRRDFKGGSFRGLFEDDRLHEEIVTQRV